MGNLPVWVGATIGLMAAIGQIVVLRELLVLFHGNELSTGLIFAAWLVGTAVGSRVGARWSGRIAREPGALAVGVLWLAVSLPLSLVWLRASRFVWAIPAGQLASPLYMVGITFSGTLPFC